MERAVQEMENARYEVEMKLMDVDEKYTAILCDAIKRPICC